MQRLTRFLDDVHQLTRAFQDRSVRVATLVFVLFVASLLGIRLFYPLVFGRLVLNLFVSLLGALFGVFISIELLLPYVRHVERRRIAPVEDIVSEYEKRETFVDVSTLPGWNGSHAPETIPVAVEHAPDSVHSVDSFHNRVSDEMYEISPKLRALYEPYDDELGELFHSEKRSNGVKVRLDGVSDAEFKLSQTTYYRSFITNFCPDYELPDGNTLRRLTEPYLFEDDGTPRPLAEAPFSNHFGGGGMVITTDGRALVAVRSKTVAVEGNAVHLSFSSSFDLDEVESGGVERAMLNTIVEEPKIPKRDVRSLTYLGTTRRIERLGKPDAVALALVDGDVRYGRGTEQFVRIEEVDLFPAESDVSLSQDALFEDETAARIVERLFDHVRESPYRPSIGLLSFLWLYNSLANSEPGSFE